MIQIKDMRWLKGSFFQKTRCINILLDGLFGGSVCEESVLQCQIPGFWSLSLEGPLEMEMATYQYSHLENSIERGALWAQYLGL